MKLPTIRDFYREALYVWEDEFEACTGFPSRPSRKERLEMLKEAAARWDSMMEAYREWRPRRERECPDCSTVDCNVNH